MTIVIAIIIAKQLIRRLLMDNGSSINLIYWNYFEKLNISFDKMKAISSPLYSFTREVVPIAREIQFVLALGIEPQSIMR